MSSSDPAYRHTATALSPSLDLEDVTISEPSRSDGRGGIEDVAGLGGHRERSTPLGRPAPRHQLIGPRRHAAAIRGDDDTARESVAPAAAQVEAHRTHTPALGT